MSGVFVGMGPWILYWVLVSNNTFEEAAVAGLVASGIVTAWGLTHGGLKTLEVGTVAWFAVLTIASFTADERFFADWCFVMSNGALATIVLVSILTGHPFTRQYARDTVPEQFWESPVFLQSTLVISWAWFAAFVVMTASSAVTRSYPDEELWFNWIIPIGAMVGAFKFTGWYPAYLKKTAQHPAVTGL